MFPIRSVLFSLEERICHTDQRNHADIRAANLTDGRYCEEHISCHPEVTRSATKRGYGSKWRTSSKAYLREHPLCEICKRNGKYVQATVVDHIKPHRGDNKLFWDKSNWQSLCKSCHDKKTGRFDSKPTYSY